LTSIAIPDTRERILRTTLELIGNEGIGAVTNRRVATAAGVSLGSLTYHFASQVDLLRDSLLLFVGEEVNRLEGVAADLRRRKPPIEQIAAEVEQLAGESSNRLQQLAELELHLRAARDPDLREASRRCFEAYEGVAEAALEMLSVPHPERHARSIVALIYGLGVRRLGTGEEDTAGLAEALLGIIRGASV
jgi:TetR/AcrR family transcriptional regulator, regulator of biofilm formation and stress response